MKRKTGVIAAVLVGAVLVVLAAALSGLIPAPATNSNGSSCPDPIPGNQYWVVYNSTTGNVDAVVTFAGGHNASVGLLPGQAALNITGEPVAGPVMCDARAGNTGLWRVDLTTKELVKA